MQRSNFYFWMLMNGNDLQIDYYKKMKSKAICYPEKTTFLCYYSSKSLNEIHLRLFQGSLWKAQCKVDIFSKWKYLLAHCGKQVSGVSGLTAILSKLFCKLARPDSPPDKFHFSIICLLLLVGTCQSSVVDCLGTCFHKVWLTSVPLGPPCRNTSLIPL